MCSLAGAGVAQQKSSAARPPAAPGDASKSAPAKPQDQKASAYFNYAMGHMYAELAGAYGYRSDYVSRAIEHYRAALEADPGASFVSEELTDLYMQSGKLRDAVTEAEDILKRNPDNLEARRMLGRIYARLIGDQQTNRIDDRMVKKAIEQYEKITQKDPQDADSWLMLGRLYKLSQDSVSAEKAYKKALELDPDNAFALSGLAKVYSDLGDTKTALELWRRLTDKDPSAQHLRLLAEAYEQSHDYKSAAETLRRALEAAPRDPELKANLADDLFLSDQTEEALKLYGELAQADPKNPRIQVRISQLYRQKRDFAKAHAAQDAALALDPDNLETLYNGVKLLEAEGKLPEAIAKLREMLDTTAKKAYGPGEIGSRAGLLEQLGVLFRMNEQFPEAVETFQKIVALDPDGGGKASAQTIETYRQAKDFNRALTEADAAAKKYPNDRTLKAVRASLLADVGRTDEAVAVTKQLLDGKNDRETYLSLAQIYDKGKRFKDEADALNAAEKLSSSNDDRETVYFLRGAMYEKMKNLEASEVEFRKVLQINPENASALNYLGYMFADRNVRLEEAHRMIARALELEPNNGAYLDSLGWVNYRMGKLDEAEANLRQALARTSRDPTVHDHLGDVLMQKGQVKDAISQWELSLNEWQTTAKSDVDPQEIAKVQKKLEGARMRLAKESSGATTRR